LMDDQPVKSNLSYLINEKIKNNTVIIKAKKVFIF